MSKETNTVKCPNPECSMEFKSMPIIPHPDHPEFNVIDTQFMFNIKCPKCDTMVKMVTKEMK